MTQHPTQIGTAGQAQLVLQLLSVPSLRPTPPVQPHSNAEQLLITIQQTCRAALQHLLPRGALLRVRVRRERQRTGLASAASGGHQSHSGSRGLRSSGKSYAALRVFWTTFLTAIQAACRLWRRSCRVVRHRDSPRRLLSKVPEHSVYCHTLRHSTLIVQTHFSNA